MEETTQNDAYTVRQVTLVAGDSSTHETRAGTEVTLFGNKDTPMSEEEARTFLIDPDSFEVKDEKGRPVLAPSQKTNIGAGVKLDLDEVIAKLHELTREALYNRCLRLPGVTVQKIMKKDALINELLNAPKEQASVARGSEGIAPEINTAGIPFKDTDEMLAGVPVVGG